jgi:3-methylcrotonyl-CoA carboxylase alpha subunit
MINRVLIANRGEIACRIIKTLKEINIIAIAVYSHADKNSKHVLLADEAYSIGGSPASESYLNIKSIVNIAKLHNADAIHPGYGFLSENANFAKAVTEAGIKFIGPSAKVIDTMGNKSVAKKFMKEAGVPLLPGLDIAQDDSNIEEVKKIVEFPMLVKASAGGGGKGMRVVNTEQDMQTAIDSCRREALTSFGDSSIMAEKFLTNARHIEVQVAADQHGNVVHLFERDCSMQRRHQKVIEEAPAVGISDSLKSKMFDCVINATKKLQYEGVGTFEFLVENDSFFFLEVNTRLQVEHPVTEKITGIDLVQLQVIIANGEKIPYKQSEIICKGHAIECRIYAEDPANNFLPDTGQIAHISYQANEKIRVDSGITAGSNISMFYDPMLAKIIAYSDNRDICIREASNFLQQYAVYGVITNVSFLRSILSSSEFQSLKYNTKTLDDHKISLPSPDNITILNGLALATVFNLQELEYPLRLNQRNNFSSYLSYKNKSYKIITSSLADNSWEIDIDGEKLQLSNYNEESNSISANINDNSISSTAFSNLDSIFITINGFDLSFSKHNYAIGGSILGDDNTIVSPMSGVIRKINVQTNDKVNDKDVLVVVEAMKMEHSITCTGEKIVETLSCKVGDFVSTGQTLITLK